MDAAAALIDDVVSCEEGWCNSAEFDEEWLRCYVRPQSPYKVPSVSWYGGWPPEARTTLKFRRGLQSAVSFHVILLWMWCVIHYAHEEERRCCGEERLAVTNWAWDLGGEARARDLVRPLLIICGELARSASGWVMRSCILIMVPRSDILYKQNKNNNTIKGWK